MDNSLKKGRITSHSNKIGLYDPHRQGFIAQSGDVVLSFPYKDCVLEGGMSDEESGREEKFFHETLDRADIDVLRDLKVLTKFEKIDRDGIHPIMNADEVEFFDEDGNLRENLLIKGNNLIALYSLRQRLAGKVKLIYIDPPYNTGSDGFRYNDSFNHSTWLVFMRNRLEIARELLRDDGTIFINLDDNEAHYCKVLCDEIFGRECFIGSLFWKGTTQPDNIGKARFGLQKNIEHILFYSKIEKDNLSGFNLELNESSKNYIYTQNNKKCRYEIIERAAEGAYARPTMQFEILGQKPRPGKQWQIGLEVAKQLESENKIIIDNGIIKRVVYEKDDMDRGSYKPFWSFLDSEELTGTSQSGKAHLKQISTNTVFETVKPEQLIGKLIKLCTNTNDIVLDYHLGSGTTAAVAHKLGRKYIGIEQMDYIEDIAKVRLQKVIEGEQGGISKSVDWKGGGDFIYMELKTYNIEYLERIEGSTTKEELQKVYIDMAHNAFLQFWFDRRDFEREGYKALSLEEQKIKLRELLDMNHLYLNALDMDDTRHRITPLERSLTTKFYGNQEI